MSYIRTPEHREKMRQLLSGKPKPHKGFVHSEETRKKQGETMKKNWQNPVYRKRNTEAVRESRKNPDVIHRIAQSTREAMARPEIKEKLTGKNHPNWQGGIAFEPYCPKFNEEFKERVREFFGYICVECSTPQNGERLHVHHVNFNKDTCCDSTIPLFVPLCRACHGKTQHNRPYWQQHFTDMINQYYGGKCYLPKAEVSQ